MQRLSIALIAFVSIANSALSTDYHIGPGQPLDELRDVAFHNLQAGDRVYIYAKPTPYFEKIRISGQGTSTSPIKIVGVPDANGNLPILDATEATTHPADIYSWDPMSSAGVITVIRGPGTAYEYKPKWIQIENLEIRNARTEPVQTYFFDANGQRRPWTDGAAGLYLLGAENVTVTGCKIHTNANGIFFKSNGGEESTTRNLVFERNYIFNNSELTQIVVNGQTIWRFATHNVYGEGQNVTYRYNRFGPIFNGRDGANLKDRSSGLVLSCNWIEGGNRLLDLVEAQDGFAVIGNDPAYRHTHVFGNVLISGPGQSITAVHYGGDSGTESTYRKGTLWFWNNTVYVRRDQSESWRFMVFDLSTNDETCSAQNNVLHVEPLTVGGTPPIFALMLQNGNLALGKNWVQQGYVQWRDNITPQGSITGLTNLVTGASPGFINGSNYQLRPAAGSPLINSGTTLTGQMAVFPLDKQYQEHQNFQTRMIVGTALDIGAWESGASGPPTPPGLPDLATASDSGISNTDNITNVTSPVFTGSGISGHTVRLYDGGTTQIGSGTVGTSGYTVQVSLASGTHSITAKFLDAAGVLSAASPALSVGVDTTAPGTPGTPDLAASSDDGPSNIDNNTSVTSPFFNGSGTNGDRVLLYDGTTSPTQIGSGSVGTGGYSVQVSQLSSGTHAIRAKFMDTAGNTSAAFSSALNVVISVRIVIFENDASQLTFANGHANQTPLIVSGQGVSSSVAIKYPNIVPNNFTRLDAWYFPAKSTTQLTATSTFTISVDAGNISAPINGALVYFNRFPWETSPVSIALPQINTTAGYQTFTIPLGTVASQLGGSVNMINISHGNWPVTTLWFDNGWFNQ